MILPSDKAYKATKQIMLGKATMNPDFRELAGFIDQAFGVKTVNILYEIMEPEKRPALNICFEFEWEKQSFNDNEGYFNYDHNKQKRIADQFRQSVKEQKVIKKKGWANFFKKPQPGKYKTDRLFIYSSAFEPIARIEANENIPLERITELKNKIHNRDLWEIRKDFSAVTFFLYTDEQVKRYENSETRKGWTNEYFNLLAPYNEFGYFKRNTFNISLDSKENFDNNYESNWYYYYK